MIDYPPVGMRQVSSGKSLSITLVEGNSIGLIPEHTTQTTLTLLSHTGIPHFQHALADSTLHTVTEQIPIQIPSHDADLVKHVYTHARVQTSRI